MYSSLRRTIFVLCAIYSPSALALDGNFALDMGMASISRAHADSLLPVRRMPSTLSLIPRYQVEGAAYLYPSLDWGASIGAADSTQGPVALGLVYQRESLQYGLDSSLLPGWKLPGEEVEQLSVHSLVGASMGISFLNRSLSLGVGGFYFGTASDLNVLTHAFELNLSMGAKFADQVILGVGLVDALDAVDGSSLEFGVRWGLLDASGPLWKRCMDDSDVYYSSGGLEVDAGYSLRDGVPAFVGVAGDLPLDCYVSIRGGYQRDFLAQDNIFGAGISFDQIFSAIGYDVQLIPAEDGLEHRHLVSFRFRLSAKPFEPRPNL
ncbi:MAG: hypothetical protein VX278_12895 [Myxococcota bacterium]|nr:hypothetical protein [Myxococcota bacterium]